MRAACLVTLAAALAVANAYPTYFAMLHPNQCLAMPTGPLGPHLAPVKSDP
jgi:hypothetical protein